MRLIKSFKFKMLQSFKFLFFKKKLFKIISNSALLNYNLTNSIKMEPAKLDMFETES